MPSKLPHTAIRIQPGLMRKFRYIAAYNGRSANKEIEQLIRKCVEAFEKEHGSIELPDDTKES